MYAEFVGAAKRQCDCLGEARGGKLGGVMEGKAMGVDECQWAGWLADERPVFLQADKRLHTSGPGCVYLTAICT